MTKRKPKELLKIKRYDISPEEVERLWKLYESGMSIKQISIETKIGYWTLRNRFLGAGHKSRIRSEAYELALSQGRIGNGSKGKFRDESSNWKGGRIVDMYGYVHLLIPGHPRAAKGGGYVREHLVVWENHNGYSLPKGWQIHHVNGVKSDNRIENLLALSSHEHSKVIPFLRNKIRELEEKIKELEKVNG
jgi:hypothetical protein